MRYGVSGRLKKWVALAVSIALVICTAPAVPALADGTTKRIVKQVNFCKFDETTKAVLSISPDFDRTKDLEDGKVVEQNPINGTQWILATEDSSSSSMDAEVKGNKIIFPTRNRSCNTVEVKHKQASSVLGSAKRVASVLSTKDKEILNYGYINDSVTAESSSFTIPTGLEKGTYYLYIFAEDNSNVSTQNRLNISKLGNPIEVEVFSSFGVDITDISAPKAGEVPNTQAVLKIIEKDDVIEEKNINISWIDESLQEVQGKFEYNRNYSVYVTGLEEYVDGYIADYHSVDAKINGSMAMSDIPLTGETFNIYGGFSDYRTEQFDRIKVSGSVGDDNTVTLKAYTGVTPPVTANPEYTYEWWNDSETSRPVETGQSHVVTQDDFTSGRIWIKLNTASQTNAASTVLNITDGFIETDTIEGVSKTDTSVKGKSDGRIEGLTTDMAYSLNWGSYKPCDSSKLEGLPLGTICRIKMEKTNLTPSGLSGIYADYIIEEGDGMLVVSFDSKGGSAVNDISTAYNETITEPAAPVKEGYTFDGWYTDETSDIKWNFSEDRVTQNITLFARWRQNQAAGPAGTQKPSITTAPDNTNTQEPPVTTAPVSTATPQAGSNPAQPYIPQPSSQVTAAPSQTEAPVSTQEPPVQTQEPVQTQSPVQTQEPAQTQVPVIQPSSQPASSQPPAATQEPVPSQQPPAQTQEPVPSQIPAATPGANLPAGSPVPEGEKVVTGGTEYKVSRDGSATISGIVALNKKNIEIPATITVNGVKYKITAIEKNAFANAKKLKTVIIPSSVKTIGAGAFKNCKKLKEIKLPSSVTTIEKNAFKNCKKLKRVVIGKRENNSKKVTRKLALRYGTNVAKVSIGASAFENCTDLRSVVINSQVTKIGNSTFRYCSQLRKMLVKSLKLKKVGNKALQGVNNCKIKVPPVKLKPYTTLFKNKGQGKKVVVAKS